MGRRGLCLLLGSLAAPACRARLGQPQQAVYGAQQPSGYGGYGPYDAYGYGAVASPYGYPGSAPYTAQAPYPGVQTYGGYAGGTPPYGQPAAAAPAAGVPVEQAREVKPAAPTVKAAPLSESKKRARPVEDYIHGLVHVGDNSAKEAVVNMFKEASNKAETDQAVQFRQRMATGLQMAGLGGVALYNRGRKLYKVVKGLRNSTNKTEYVENVVKKVMTGKKGRAIGMIALPALANKYMGSVPRGERMLNLASVALGAMLGKNETEETKERAAKAQREFERKEKIDEHLAEQHALTPGAEDPQDVWRKSYSSADDAAKALVAQKKGPQEDLDDDPPVPDEVPVKAADQVPDMSQVILDGA